MLRSLALAVCCLALPGVPALAADVAADADADADAGSDTPTENWAVHGELNNVTQYHPTFGAAYSGPNSLQASHQNAETTGLGLYLGARPWHDAEFWVDADIDQGFGLSGTQGVAGYPNGEAYKVGADRPYGRLSRAFLRVTTPLGGGPVAVQAAQTQLGGQTTGDSLVTTIGKFSVTDLFDANAYAHDPRHDFLNWSVIESGAFDYAADPWGYTFGLASELNMGRWTLRAGVFQLSPEPNSLIHGLDLANHMLVAELEERHSLLGAAGKVRLLWFSNRAPMARYDDAVALAQANGGTPDVSLVRRRSSREGVALNLEQAIDADIGAFLRLSANDGSKEAYEFTDINRSLATGASVAGGAWGRSSDRLGVAAAFDAISAQARRYFAAGGTGILIGDGALRYGTEQIAEAYYALDLFGHAALSFDYQFIRNPGYNRDRGPVSVYGLRLHAEF